MTRSTVLQVRLTPTEREEVRRRARVAGLDESSWVRLALLGDAVEEIPPGVRSVVAEARATAALQLAEEGRSRQEIARLLGVSTEQVRRYLLGGQ